MDLTSIKEKLLHYGISYEAYLRFTGNLIGRMNVPTQLLSFNKNLTAEEAFYLVANKVYEAANISAFGIPGKMTIKFKEIIGLEAFRDFQVAIYEEINQRFLSNTFPEFANAGSASFANININSPISGGSSINDWLNTLSVQKIRNIDWLSYDLNSQTPPENIFLYTNLENANLPVGELRMMQITEAGTFLMQPASMYALSSSVDDLNLTLENTIHNQVQNTSEINALKTEMENKASITYVNNVVQALPKAEVYDPLKVYGIPQIVMFQGSLYWNLQENNINHTPGGITGQGWWEKISDIREPEIYYELAYLTGTDLKRSITNPNQLYYLDLQVLIDNFETLNQDNLFNLLNERFPHLNLTEEQVSNFYQNFCNKDNTNIKKIYELDDKILYKANDVSWFATKADFELIENLELNVDYSLFPMGYNLFLGENGTTLGSDKIKQSDLPDINLKHKHFITLTSGSGSNYRPAEIGGSGSPVKETQETDLFLNGGVPQTSYIPKSLEMYSIKWLKTIYEKSPLKIFVNVVGINLKGLVITKNIGAK